MCKCDWQLVSGTFQCYLNTVISPHTYILLHRFILCGPGRANGQESAVAGDVGHEEARSTSPTLVDGDWEIVSPDKNEAVSTRRKMAVYACSVEQSMYAARVSTPCIC